MPLTLALIFLLLYLNFGRLTETLIVMLSLPFALVGGVWLMWWLGFNASVAVVVGSIALAGVAAETGVIMLIYLDQALREQRETCEREGRSFGRADLNCAIMVGAVERVRPKTMTVVAIMAGLLTLIVIPAVYGIVKGFGLGKTGRTQPTAPEIVSSQALKGA